MNQLLQTDVKIAIPWLAEGLHAWSVARVKVKAIGRSNDAALKIGLSRLLTHRLHEWGGAGQQSWYTDALNCPGTLQLEDVMENGMPD